MAQDSIADLERAQFRITAFAQALLTVDEGGVLRTAIETELAHIADRAQQAILAAAPKATNELARSIKIIPAKGKRLGFSVTAGAFTKRGENYAFFTELGTDAAANHAVDKIGYQHVSKPNSESKSAGIAAMHWFSGPWAEATKDAHDDVMGAIRRGFDTIFTQ